MDQDFADFMACKPGSPRASGLVAGAAAPPAPPLPNAASNARYKDSIDAKAFPHRTVTTAAWIKAVAGTGAATTQQVQPSTDTAAMIPG